MPRILIVGYGNPLLSDDGLGWHAAEYLSTILTCPDIQILSCHQLTPELAETVSQAELVIFIDARRGGEPGTIDCHEIPNRFSMNTSSAQRPPSLLHQLSPAAVLALAHDLYGVAPRCYVLSVIGASFEPGSTLSPQVAASLPALAAQVQSLISRK